MHLVFIFLTVMNGIYFCRNPLIFTIICFFIYYFRAIFFSWDIFRPFYILFTEEFYSFIKYIIIIFRKILHFWIYILINLKSLFDKIINYFIMFNPLTLILFLLFFHFLMLIVITVYKTKNNNTLYKIFNLFYLILAFLIAIPLFF